MKDLDNKHLDNNKADLSDPNHAQTSRSNQASGIYERFLNRVQNIDSTDSIDSPDIKSAAIITIKQPDRQTAFEPLNDAELLSFTKPDHTTDLQKESAILNDNDEDKVVEPFSTENSVFDSDNLVVAPVKSLNSQQTAVLKNTQVSSLKSMITGIVCGLLLSIFTILLLNMTGVLTTLTERFSKKSEPISTNSAISTEPIASREPLADENSVIKTDDTNQKATNIDETVASTNLADEMVNSDQTIEGDSTNPIARTSDASVVKTETSISYEDFREEAQNTLYRETKN